jgi:hypothetical protein
MAAANRAKFFPTSHNLSFAFASLYSQCMIDAKRKTEFLKELTKKGGL